MDLLTILVFASIVASIPTFFSYFTFQSVMKAVATFITTSALVITLLTLGSYTKTDNWITNYSVSITGLGLLGLLAPLGWNYDKKINKTNIMFVLVVIVINSITITSGLYFAGVFFSVMFALIVMAAGGFDKPEQPKTLCQLNIDKN